MKSQSEKTTGNIPNAKKIKKNKRKQNDEKKALIKSNKSIYKKEKQIVKKKQRKKNEKTKQLPPRENTSKKKNLLKSDHTLKDAENNQTNYLSNINILFEEHNPIRKSKDAFTKNDRDKNTPFKDRQQYKKKKKMDENPEDVVKSSLFRYINEYMYTNKSDVVQKKLNETKNIFNIYHSGYDNQKSKWPENPINPIIEYLKKNFTKNSKIADLGCGEATIAQTLKQWNIDSFDFIKYNDYVTVCNITNLLEKEDTYDCCILSLSLMNTDWPKVIFESMRCLKQGGTLIIAEVVSRFKNYKAFIKFLTNIGFKYMKKINLRNFFFILFFELKKKDKIKYTVNEKRVNQLSGLLIPCMYKRR